MSSITYSERIKIEIFCELGLANAKMVERLNQLSATISYKLSRCQSYQTELAQTNAEYKGARCGQGTNLIAELKPIIITHLRLNLSTKVIAHELKLTTKSIYNWLY